MDLALEAWLRELWAQRGLPFSAVNLKQAWLIPSAEALPNPNGTAPGWWVERDGRVVIALPGPPRELKPMWRDHVLPRLRERGLGIDRAAETLRLTGIGESMVVDLVGKDLLQDDNPRMATYARVDSVDLRVSADGTEGRPAADIVAEAVASLSPRIDAYVFGRGDDDWRVALGPRLGELRLATVEIGTSGYLGMLLGSSPFLLHAEQVASATQEAAPLAADVRARTGADVGLAAIARDAGEDMSVDIGICAGAESWQVTRTVFRGGDAGRRRAANAAAAELWRTLGGPTRP